MDSASARTELEEMYNFTIVPNSPVKIVDNGDGWTCYNFLIEYGEKEELKFDNLVLQVKSDEVRAVIEPDEVESPPVPCDELKKLGDPASRNIKPQIDVLRANANLPIPTNEMGVEFSFTENPDGTVSYNNLLQIGGANDVNTCYLTDQVGGAHNHNALGLHIPSYGDVHWLVAAYYNSTRNPKNEVMSVVVMPNLGRQPVTYALYVENLGPLMNYVDAIWNNVKYAQYTKPEDKLNAIHSDLNVSYLRNGGPMLGFLQKFTTRGLSLYRADDDTMTKWSKITLQNGTITVTPCP